MRDRAQHREMLDQVLKLFSIVPDYDHQHQPEAGAGATGSPVASPRRAEAGAGSTSPDVVLVHGDTTTTMAASLAAFYQRIPVGHVESRPAHRRFKFAVAGRQPYVDRPSGDIPFRPTETSRQEPAAGKYCRRSDHGYREYGHLQPLFWAGSGAWVMKATETLRSAILSSAGKR